MEEQVNILLISLGDTFWSRVQASTLVLKSYVLAQNPQINIQVKMFDMEMDATEDIAHQICESQPVIIGFTMHIFTDKKVLAVAQCLKTLAPELTIIVGGGVPTYEAKYLIETYPFFDICVKGQGEKTFLRVIEHLQAGNYDMSDIPNLVYRNQEHIIETPHIFDFTIEEINYPLLLDDVKHEEFFFVEMSRGCIYNCKYCAYNMNLAKKNTICYYPWEKVEGDLRALFALPKLKRLAFADSSIFVDKARGLKLLKQINQLNDQRCKEKKAPIDIALEFTLERLDYDMLMALRETFMGFDGTSIGLQSIDKDVLRACSRPAFKKERFLENANILSANGKIPLNTELIFGMPEDTYEKFKHAFEFCLSELNANSVVCFRFRVIPGSEFYAHKDQYGLIAQEHSPYALISSPTFSAEDLQKAEVLSFMFELISRIFKNVKRLVDENCSGRKVDTYEAIARMISEKYHDFFRVETLCRHDVYEYMNKLSKEDRALRRQLLVDMRATVKDFIVEHTQQMN